MIRFWLIINKIVELFMIQSNKMTPYYVWYFPNKIFIKYVGNFFSTLLYQTIYGLKNII